MVPTPSFVGRIWDGLFQNLPMGSLVATEDGLSHRRNVYAR